MGKTKENIDIKRFHEIKAQNLDLAVIGNCETAALVNSSGRILWSCWPYFDSNPLFSSLINQNEEGKSENGFWDIRIKGFSHAKQFYQRNTAILETHLFSEKGDAVRIIDFMPRYKHYDRFFKELSIVRVVEPLQGTPIIQMRIRPTDNYGAESFEKIVSSNHILFQSSKNKYRLTTDLSPSQIADEHEFLLNKRVHFYLTNNVSVQGNLAEHCTQLLDRTNDYWQNFTRHLHVPINWQEEVIRATITLKLCTYEDTGAVLAALTTSIPESDKTVRNWDYRYCWLRDSFFTVTALNQMNITDTMENYLDFILHITEGYDSGDIQPLFGIHHETEIEEFFADSFSGMRGNKPVRVGNAAYSQIQNDSYGSIIMTMMQLFYDRRLMRMGDENLFKKLEAFGNQALKVWDKPDAGIWEYRGFKSVRTYSAVMCWTALDRLAKIAKLLKLKKRETYWREHADKIREEILEKSWNAEMGCFVESFGGTFLDASLLLLHEFNFIDPMDERYIKTVEKIGEKLKRGDFLFRYINEDDFGEPEAFFTICTFWYISALEAIGRRDEAIKLFERLMTKRNHVGLLSEDLDPKTDALWGNFPQTYSMVGIIKCAHLLSEKWSDYV